MILNNYDSTSLAAFIILAISFVFLIAINLIYWIKLNKNLPIAFRIIALLLLNELLVVSSELLPFINIDI